MKINKKIILEGPDGSGKSTLAEYLSERWGVKPHHAGGPPKDRKTLIQNIEKMFVSTDVLFDRTSIISEPVYRKSFGEECRLTPEDMKNYTAGLSNDEYIVIYCRPSIETMQTAWKNRAEKAHKSPEHCAKVTENQLKIVYNYDGLMRLMRTFGVYIVEFNWEETPLTDFADFLEKLCVE